MSLGGAGKEDRETIVSFDGINFSVTERLDIDDLGVRPSLSIRLENKCLSYDLP